MMSISKELKKKSKKRKNKEIYVYKNANVIKILCYRLDYEK
jgi:hypothetical protein